MTTRFDRLEAGQSITNGGQGPSLQFQVWAQRLLEELEAALTAIETVNDEQTAMLQQILAAQAGADNANRRIAIAGSYTSAVSGGGDVLTAADAGDGTATITIKDHVRNYSADTDYDPVAIIGAAFTGLDQGADYFVYYDDPTLAVEDPEFVLTQNGTEAQANRVPGRIPLGPIKTPGAGDPPSGGGGSPPPAGGGGPPGQHPL